MGYLIRIAFKNLFRHKLRTFVSIIAVAFSVMIVVFARGYIVGLIDATFADHIQYNSGHIKIVKDKYHNQQRLLPLNYPVDGFKEEGLEEMTADLEKIKNIEMVIPRLKFGAAASIDDELVNMSGWGVDPAKELEFTNVEDLLVEGEMIETGELEVVMGTALLEKLNKNVGDKITILFNTAFNSLNGVTFTITGRLESGIKMLNEVVFYLPLDQAQRYLYMNDMSTEILLTVENRQMSDNVLPEVKKLMEERGALDKYRVMSYKETSDLLPYLEIAKVIYNQVYIFLVLLACIVVVNTFIMIVKERTREIGMMQALGLESKNILQLFVMEGAIIGIIGSFFGALSGGLINGYLAKTGMDFSSALSGMSADVIMNSIIYPVSSTANTFFAFVLGVVIVTIACIIPARRAAGLEPTEAMREV